MIETEGFKQELAAIREMIEEAGRSLDLEKLQQQLIECNEDMASPGFWDDTKRAQHVSTQARICENKIEHFKSLQDRADEIEIMMELAEEEEDASMAADIQAEFASLKDDLEKLRLQTLLTGEYDQNTCILSLHAGAGGTEAQDWTSMLYRMYTRFAERSVGVENFIHDARNLFDRAAPWLALAVLALFAVSVLYTGSL